MGRTRSRSTAIGVNEASSGTTGPPSLPSERGVGPVWSSIPKLRQRPSLLGVTDSPSVNGYMTGQDPGRLCDRMQPPATGPKPTTPGPQRCTLRPLERHDTPLTDAYHSPNDT